MSRSFMFVAPLTALLPLCIPASTQAQQYTGEVPARLTSQEGATPIYYVGSPDEAQDVPASQTSACPQCNYGQGPGSYGHYPHFNGSLYPSPRPNIPVQMGMTAITNQAFAPHEMLYEHKYKALYPPFYYRVKGGWFWTPLGMHSHDNWKLEGTKVTVKYRSKYKLFSSFKPPFHR